MRFRSSLILAVCGFFCFTKPLFSEIEIVTIKWVPGICNESCHIGLDRKLKMMSDVAEVLVSNEQALLRWKPNHKMVYSALENAMATIGVAMDELQIKVRGTIKQTGRDIKLISIGDGTEFVLLGPVQISKNQAPILENPQTLKLTEEMRQRFIQAEREFKVVTIQGPFFQPERSPPYYIIAERIDIPPSLSQGQPQQRPQPKTAQQQQQHPPQYAQPSYQNKPVNKNAIKPVPHQPSF